MQTLGWLGSVLLALCAIPLAWRCYQQKHAIGIANLSIAMWFFGEVLTFIYVLSKHEWPLLANYGLNICCLVVIIRYKIKTNWQQ